MNTLTPTSNWYFKVNRQAACSFIQGSPTSQLVVIKWLIVSSGANMSPLKLLYLIYLYWWKHVAGGVAHPFQRTILLAIKIQSFTLCVHHTRREIHIFNLKTITIFFIGLTLKYRFQKAAFEDFMNMFVSNVTG